MVYKDGKEKTLDRIEPVCIPFKGARKNMRTGPVDEPLGIDLSFVQMIESISIAIVSRSYEVAARYCAAAGREIPTETDCMYGLRFEVRRFATDDSIEERVKEIQNALCERDDSETSDGELSDGEYDDVEEDEDDDDDSEDNDELDDLDFVPETDVEPFCRADESRVAEEHAEFVRAVHEAVDTWDEWTPTDPVERFLKATVEKNPVKIQRHLV